MVSFIKITIIFFLLSGCDNYHQPVIVDRVTGESEISSNDGRMVYVEHFVVSHPPSTPADLKYAVTPALRAFIATNQARRWKLYAYFYRRTSVLDASFAPRPAKTCFRDCGELVHIWDFAHEDRLLTVFLTGEGCNTFWSWTFHQRTLFGGWSDVVLTERKVCGPDQ